MVENINEWRRVVCLQEDIKANVKLVMLVVGLLAEKGASPNNFECRISAQDIDRITNMGLYNASEALDGAADTGFLQVIRRDAQEPYITNICVLEYPIKFEVPKISQIYNVNTG